MDENYGRVLLAMDRLINEFFNIQTTFLGAPDDRAVGGMIKKLIERLYPFLSQSNKKSFFEVSDRSKLKAKEQMKTYFNFIHNSCVRDHMKKYALKQHKIEVINIKNDVDDLILDIKDNPPQHDQSMSMYIQKELNCMSDRVFQNFKNGGANFPSLRFVKDCREFLNSELKLHSNSLGKFK